MLIPLAGPPRFELGNLVSTPGALAAVSEEEIGRFLARHLQGDWGELDAEDIAANSAALLNEGRLVSAYRATNGTRIYIITEWDRSYTTILLPHEY